jgi:hypothetical protein
MNLRRRAVTVAATLMTTAGIATWAGTSYAAPQTAQVFVIQGLPGRTVDVTVDGRSVERDLEGATLSPQIDLSPGSHRISFSDNGSAILERSMNLEPGSSTDVVLHLPVDPAGPPLVTLYDNSTAALPAGKAALTVAHTAAVPPAAVRVNGKVLFANIANGEALNLVVPGGTYKVDIVPTGAASPVVLGPLDLPVKAGSLNRVFAVGDPASTTMRAVVHVLPVSSTGSGAPDRVDTGSGGQAAQRSDVPFGALLTHR